MTVCPYAMWFEMRPFKLFIRETYTFERVFTSQGIKLLS